MSLLAPTKARVRIAPQPSAGVWPGLFDVSNSPIHAAVAKRLIRPPSGISPSRCSFRTAETGEWADRCCRW